jgi:hypothetical protein
MKFALRMRELGAVDSAPLEQAVLAQGEDAWREFDHRQRAYDVHHDTQSIVLVFCDDRWPDVTVTRQPGWGRLVEAAEPLMGEIIGRHYRPGGLVLRAMAARLMAGGRIAPHIDALPSFVNAHRIHVPLTTNRGVRFTIDGRPCPMAPGHAYEINNQLPHSVMNAGGEHRISFIFDYLPPAH